MNSPNDVCWLMGLMKRIRRDYSQRVYVVHYKRLLKSDIMVDDGYYPMVDIMVEP